MPLFSVVIPTKNRARLVAMALESVLRQSFEDWELVLADNSDDESTRALFERCADERVRYARSGGLSMPDNWDFALARPTGEYVCVLEDKQALHFDALERLAGLIEREHPEVVRWEWDEIRPYGLGHRIRSFGGDGTTTTRSPDDALGALVHESYFKAKALLPIPHYSAIRRELLERIRGGPLGRLCPPISPDYTLALQILRYCERVTYIDASLVAFTDLSVSNGISMQMKSSLGSSFVKEIGDDEAFYSGVPVKARTVGGSIYNDFVVLRERLGGRLLDHEPDWANYYFACHESIEGSATRGVDMSEERREWRRALAAEPEELQQEVGRRISRDARRRSSFGRSLRRNRAVRSLSSSTRSVLYGRILRRPLWRYDNILDYLRWRADSGRRRQSAD